MEERLDTLKEFSLLGRVRSFTHAGRGIWLLVRTTHNAWIHLAVVVGVVMAGWWFVISALEWIAILLAIALVLLAEAINTAIEIDINLTSPTYHPYARDTKDVAAGAVLITASIAAIIGAIIFLPPVIRLLFQVLG